MNGEDKLGELVGKKRDASCGLRLVLKEIAIDVSIGGGADKLRDSDGVSEIPGVR